MMASRGKLTCILSFSSSPCVLSSQGQLEIIISIKANPAGDEQFHWFNRFILFKISEYRNIRLPLNQAQLAVTQSGRHGSQRMNLYEVSDPSTVVINPVQHLRDELAQVLVEAFTDLRGGITVTSVVTFG